MSRQVVSIFCPFMKNDKYIHVYYILNQYFFSEIHKHLSFVKTLKCLILNYDIVNLVTIKVFTVFFKEKCSAMK